MGSHLGVQMHSHSREATPHLGLGPGARCHMFDRPQHGSSPRVIDRSWCHTWAFGSYTCPPAECMARACVMHMRWSRRQSAAPCTNLPPRFSSRVHLAAHHQRMPLRIWSQNGNGGSPCSSIFRRVTTQASSHTQYHTISAEKHIISNLDRPALTNLSPRARVALRSTCSS